MSQSPVIRVLFPQIAWLQTKTPRELHLGKRTYSAMKNLGNEALRGVEESPDERRTPYSGYYGGKCKKKSSPEERASMEPSIQGKRLAD